LKYIFLLFLTFSIQAADVSEYTANGAIQNIGGTDFSGLEWGTTTDGVSGEFRVDNKTGILTYPGGSCGIGGDLEGIAMGEQGLFYAVNEAKSGISVFNVDSVTGCTAPRRFLVSGTAINIEGIAVKDGVIYLLDENTGGIYWLVDNFTGSQVKQLLFTIPNCPGAGDLAFNGENIVAICDGIPLVQEYTLGGDFVAENNYQGINNAEALYFNGNQMCLGGEPDEYLCFTSGDIIDPPPPPTEETCTYSGSIVVNIDTGAFDAQTVDFICPTIIASGVLN
jgi:hypothetical protein